MSSTSPYISKTDFLNYLTCPGYAWHARHRRELLPSLDDGAHRRMKDGMSVERLSRQTLPPGIEIYAREIREGDRQTRKAIADGATVLYQPTALSETGLVARADALIRTDNGWHLIEVKSSSIDPEKMKGTSIRKHLNDITFQGVAFRQAGIQIQKTSLLLLNRNFRMNGKIDPEELFVQVDVTEDVRNVALTVQAQIEDAARTLLDSRTPAKCDCDRKTRANRCDLFSHFHPHIPDKDTIYNIASIQKKSLLPALDRGVLDIVDWPDDIELGPKQRRQVELARSGQGAVQRDKLDTFLGSMTLPLWYLDYETFQSAIPRWEGYAPHQQITFQYSLHKWQENEEPKHYGFLAESAVEDPTLPMLQHMRQHIGESGSVIVWNKAFEHGRNVEMAHRYPEYADFLEDVNRRMVDLADCVKFGWWESPDFQGSWSLKQVLPVAAPELDYKQLEIGDGGTASERWMQAVLDSPSPLSDTERSKVLEALNIYCAQDTLAMHRIREYLRGLLS